MILRRFRSRIKQRTEVVSIIRVLNLNRETTAILENAYSISYEKQVNAIWQASFCFFERPKSK